MDRAAAVNLLRGLVAIRSFLPREEAEASARLVEEMRASGYERAFVDEAGNAVVAKSARSMRHAPWSLLGHIDTAKPGNIPVRIDATPDGDVLSAAAASMPRTMVCSSRRRRQAQPGVGACAMRDCG